jgi:hypothetical protein
VSVSDDARGYSSARSTAEKRGRGPLGENCVTKKVYYSFIRSPLTAETSSAFHHLLRTTNVEFDDVASPSAEDNP